MTRTQRLPANARTGRPRNPRGEGSRLREDIIEAATTILERTGSEYALTLRGIAREVGIAVASIFRHFDDTFAIIDAVTARQTAILHNSLSAAANSTTDSTGRLMAISRAYVTYGTDNPATYRMLLGRRWMDTWQERDYLAPDTNALLQASLGIATAAITDCVNAGISTSANPAYDTLILWFALDGLINLTTAVPSIDWPDQQQLLHDCVARATKLTLPTQTPTPIDPT